MKCPNCHKPSKWEDNPHRPFCSERCKLLDFGAWANEEYKVPSDEAAPPLEDILPDHDPSNDSDRA
ncbi:MAG: uncharacterized protein QOC99_3085 [Acidobacteriota bacterium]|nr:uncharacterized protein [Acidobacteriota bacterium]MDT7780573.1 uncharacterized protein [Acidobacteriota bacterium]